METSVTSKFILQPLSKNIFNPAEVSKHFENSLKTSLAFLFGASLICLIFAVLPLIYQYLFLVKKDSKFIKYSLKVHNCAVYASLICSFISFVSLFLYSKALFNSPQWLKLSIISCIKALFAHVIIPHHNFIYVSALTFLCLFINQTIYLKMIFKQVNITPKEDISNEKSIWFSSLNIFYCSLASLFVVMISSTRLSPMTSGSIPCFWIMSVMMVISFICSYRLNDNFSRIIRKK